MPVSLPPTALALGVDTQLTSADRVVVVAPHPDDESIATGGLLQHAVAARATVRVVFFTDGDNNPWAQRAVERRWRVAPADRARFAARRRDEVMAALRALGVPPDCTRFLGFPDQGATDLFFHGNELARAALAEELKAVAPTLVVAPSFLDLHPDHSAVAGLVRLAVIGVEPSPRLLSYIVHNPELRAHHDGAVGLPLDISQQTGKLAAICCHRTQQVFRGSWLRSFAEEREWFYAREPEQGLARHPVLAVGRSGGGLRFVVASRQRVRAFGARRLCLVAPQIDVHLDVPISYRRRLSVVRDPRTGADLARSTLGGTPRNGTVEVPRELLTDASHVLAKIEHEFGFFDEAGWRELALPPT